MKSVLAVLAGFFATFAITTAVDILLHTTGVFPPPEVRMSDGLFVLAFAYRAIFNTAGAYLTARLAPNNPMKHALAIGILGTVISILGAIAMWDKGPAWYSISFIVSSIPLCLLGGKLYLRQKKA